MCISSLTCCQGQVNISYNYHLLLARSPKQQAEMEVCMQKWYQGLLSGFPHVKGKRRWQGQTKKVVSCDAASTEISTNTIENSEVGTAFQSYSKLGLGGQAFITPPIHTHFNRVQTLDMGYPRKAVGSQER